MTLHQPVSLPPSVVAACRHEVNVLVRRLVPQAADFCLVHLLSRGAIRAFAWAHATREGDRLLRLLTRRYRISPGDGASGVASVLRTQCPLLRTAIQIDAAVERRGDRTAADLHRQLAPRSALVVPIVIPGAILGALTLCYSQSRRTYTARHIPSGTRIAARIARALVPPGSPLSAPPARVAVQRPSPRRRPIPRS